MSKRAGIRFVFLILFGVVLVGLTPGKLSAATPSERTTESNVSLQSANTEQHSPTISFAANGKTASITPMFGSPTSLFTNFAQAPPPPGEEADDSPTCEASDFALSWIFCPFVNGLAETADALFDNIIRPLLVTSTINPNKSTDPDNPNPIYDIWSAFRTIGNILLIIGLIVVVFGQTIGGGLVDAYTAKKALPRILVGAILLNLSIYIVAIMVDVTNIIGGGISQLITAPLNDAGHFNIKPSNGAATVGTLGIAASVGVLFVPGIFGAIMPFLALFVLLPAVLAMIGVLITLILRRGIIMALIIVSPVAFALYCLPNTEKYFKKWWETLFKTLLVYPIVVIVFAVADVISVALDIDSRNSGLAATFAKFTSILLLVLPLFLIPFAFKLAGGAIGTLVGTISGIGKKASEGIKGDRANQNSLRNRTRGNLAERATRAHDKIVKAGDAVGASRRTRYAARAANLLGDTDARMARYNHAAREREEQMSGTGRDDQRYAAVSYALEEGEAVPVGANLKDVNNNDIPVGTVMTKRRHFDSKGREISEQFAKRSKARHGNNVSNLAQDLEYTLRKAQTDEDVGNFRTAFGRIAKENNLQGKEVTDMWAAATFPHKDKFASEWYSTPKEVLGADGRTAGVNFEDVDRSPKSYGKMIGDLHKTRQSFQLGAVRGVDWRAMFKRQQEIQTKIDGGTADRDDLRQFAQTSEVMDSMVQRGIIQQNSDGEVTVSGASAEASNIIQAMQKSRKYATAATRIPPAVPGAAPTYSAETRTIYNKQAVDARQTAHDAAYNAARAAAAAAGAPIPVYVPLDKEREIAAAKAADIDVTGTEDRPAIPRIVR